MPPHPARRAARVTLAALAVVPVVALVTAAQAPRITPAGDPSVKSDTIYKLAVDPAAYPDQPFVYLLDDGVVRYEADGRATRTYRQVVQILTREAAERWGEQSFGYSAAREKLTVNWVRVLKPDGTVISDTPVHEQESNSAVAGDAPVYTDGKVRRLSLGGVAPGTLVDYSYTTETLKPVMPGDFLSSWSVATGRVTRRSRLVVDVPASLTPRIHERHLTFRRVEAVANGRRVYTWATGDVPKTEGEPFAADSALGMSIVVAAPMAWQDVAHWYAGLAKDRLALTPEIERKLSEVVAGAKTLDDSLRAAHRWVAQDFRYVSLSLGIGGYQPRLPASVFETKYGDCKDKATFFIALARRMGVTAYPVLLSSSGGVDRSLPSVSAFDHMIAAVERPAGHGTPGYLFVDLTAELTPYGTLPPAEQGEFGLVVHPDGRGEEVTFPEEPASTNRSTTLVSGELSPDGIFTGHYVQTASGAQQYELRDAFTTTLSDKERQQAARALANRIFEGASGDSLTGFDGRDLRAEPRLSVLIKDAHAVQSAGGLDILHLPLPNYASPGLITDLQQRGPRKYPIDVAEVVGPGETVAELRITLPAGWKARLPAAVTAESEFGRYRAVYEQQGRELHIARTLSGAKGVQPPEKIDALIAWLQAVAKDDVKFVVLEH